MADDAVVACIATNRDVADSPPSPFQDCRDVVHLSLFFDGTGNNWEKDAPTKSWSNVGRMFDAAILDRAKSTYPIYIAGVGTPYNGKATGWLDSTGIWVGDTIGGLAFGGGGDRRLRQGEDAVNDVLKKVLIANAQAAGRELATYAANATEKGFAEVNDVLSQHRLIKIITMSLFGFSRGAALSRAFSNRVISQSVKSGTDLYFHSHRLRLQFMGVFDTVASFGVPSTNARLPFQERDLIVSPRVERCVHYVAAHEVRFAFPVDLIRKDGKLAGAWEEKVYPGAHSDVGGGYGPDAQGISDNYSRIPMRDMMRESVVSGVRMRSYEQVEEWREVLFNERFKCDPATFAAYRKYMAACGALSGTVESQIKRHLEVFYSANGTMHRQGMQSPGQRRREESWSRRIGPVGMEEEIRRHRTAVKQGQGVRMGGDHVNGYTQYVKLEEWQVSAWDTPASTGVVGFVSHFIHDSKVDFVLNAEPFSYFKPRGVLESTVSVWTEWGDWIGGKASAVSDAVSGTYESGKRQVGQAVDTTTQAAKDAAAEAQRRADALVAAAERKAEETKQYALQKAAEARDAAKRTYDAAATAASDAADAAQARAHELADYARRQAHAAGNAIDRGVHATTAAGRDAAAAASRKAAEVGDDAHRLYDRGVNWIKRQANDWF
jgi:hypothetical protein